MHKNAKIVNILHIFRIFISILQQFLKLCYNREDFREHCGNYQRPPEEAGNEHERKIYRIQESCCGDKI